MLLLARYCFNLNVKLAFFHHIQKADYKTTSYAFRLVTVNLYLLVVISMSMAGRLKWIITVWCLNRYLFHQCHWLQSPGEVSLLQFIIYFCNLHLYAMLVSYNFSLTNAFPVCRNLIYQSNRRLWERNFWWINYGCGWSAKAHARKGWGYLVLISNSSFKITVTFREARSIFQGYETLRHP